MTVNQELIVLTYKVLTFFKGHVFLLCNEERKIEAL